MRAITIFGVQSGRTTMHWTSECSSMNARMHARTRLHSRACVHSTCAVSSARSFPDARGHNYISHNYIGHNYIASARLFPDARARAHVQARFGMTCLDMYFGHALMSDQCPGIHEQDFQKRNQCLHVCVHARTRTHAHRNFTSSVQP